MFLFCNLLQFRYAMGVECLMWMCQFVVIHLELVVPAEHTPVGSLDPKWQKLVAVTYQNDTLYKFIEFHPLCFMLFVVTTLLSTPVNLLIVLRGFAYVTGNVTSLLSTGAFGTAIYHLCIEKREALTNTCLTVNIITGAFTEVLVACTVYTNTLCMFEHCLSTLDLQTKQTFAVAGWIGLLVVMLGCTYTTTAKYRMLHPAQAAGVCCIRLFLSVFSGRVHKVWYMLGWVCPGSRADQIHRIVLPG